ncbi:hypothetical protein N7510_008243 [Penicillium lagena]|uniref:uncharacterized protein n=1 Tax=Penicillium lagena TaxID=94218 RepID=UPI00253F79D9|nr:uncharacterized protein N7510_008243 [Penicillium lagena]KAJ5605462.1 hypothetical protein N7510_008243 [Penicillium lagena]
MADKTPLTSSLPLSIPPLLSASCIKSLMHQLTAGVFPNHNPQRNASSIGSRPTAILGTLIGVNPLSAPPWGLAIGSREWLWSGSSGLSLYLFCFSMSLRKRGCGQRRRRVYALCKADFIVSWVLEKKLYDLA